MTDLIRVPDEIDADFETRVREALERTLALVPALRAVGADEEDIRRWRGQASRREEPTASAWRRLNTRRDELRDASRTTALAIAQVRALELGPSLIRGLEGGRPLAVICAELGMTPQELTQWRAYAARPDGAAFRTLMGQVERVREARAAAERAEELERDEADFPADLRARFLESIQAGMSAAEALRRIEVASSVLARWRGHANWDAAHTAFSQDVQRALERQRMTAAEIQEEVDRQIFDPAAQARVLAELRSGKNLPAACKAADERLSADTVTQLMRRDPSLAWAVTVAIDEAMFPESRRSALIREVAGGEPIPDDHPDGAHIEAWRMRGLRGMQPYAQFLSQLEDAERAGALARRAEDLAREEGARQREAHRIARLAALRSAAMARLVSEWGFMLEQNGSIIIGGTTRPAVGLSSTLFQVSPAEDGFLVHSVTQQYRRPVGRFRKLADALEFVHMSQLGCSRCGIREEDELIDDPTRGWPGHNRLRLEALSYAELDRYDLAIEREDPFEQVPDGFESTRAGYQLRAVSPRAVLFDSSEAAWFARARLAPDDRISLRRHQSFEQSSSAICWVGNAGAHGVGTFETECAE